jgi:hypothetical protein
VRTHIFWLLLWSVYCAFADDRVPLSGVVQDSSGGVLVDVSVVAMDEETGIRHSSRTTGRGVYSLPALAPGSYKITARKPGFRTVARLNVGVSSGTSPRVDFVLPVGSIRETVTIDGSQPLVNTYDGSVGTLAGRNWIEGLPLNGRGILSLLDLAPGVIATPASGGEAGQFSVNGQRPNTNYFAIDGVSANSGVSGSAAPAQFAGGTLPGMTAFGSTQNLVSLDALEEVRIQTSSFAPEFGRLPGAQVAMTTRSGSDEFHGSLFYSLRNEKLDANDWLANSLGYGRLPARLNHWGAALGGPLLRGRTYFFSSYEALRLTQSYTWRMTTPSLETRERASSDLRPLLDAFPRPTGRDLPGGVAELTARAARPAALNAGGLRIDHALTSHISLFGRYQQAPSSTEFGVWQVDHSDLTSHRLTLGATATAGAGIINELRFGFSRASAISRWVPDSSGGAIPVDLRKYLPVTSGAEAALYGVAIGGVGELVAGDGGRNRQGQLSLHEVFGFNRGTHTLRIGLDYERLTPERVKAASSIAGSYGRLADLIAGRPPLITRSLAEPASSLLETLSVFVQDTWRVTPRLALAYGVRWELSPPPSFRESRAVYPLQPVTPEIIPAPLPVGGSGGFSPPTPGLVTVPVPSPVPAAPATVNSLWPIRYTQFAPRIGLAYRITPGSVLRAGWGLFYDTGFSAAMDPINGFPFNRWQLTSGLPATVSTSSPVEGYQFAPNLKLPRSRQWNIAWESALSRSDAVSVSYVGSSGRQLLRREGAIPPELRLAGFPEVLPVKIAGLTVATNHGASSYHALQLQYRRRLARGLQASAGYSWSHSIDVGSWDSGLALVQANEGINALRDRGSSSFDVRHVFTAASSYQLPAFAPGIWSRLSRGWAIESMLRARSGFPIDIRDTENLLGLGFDNITRPDWHAGVPVWIVDAGVPGGRRLNSAAFSLSPPALQGSLGRNAIRGLGMAQIDLALKRSFSLHERSALEFRVEAFNSLNHANLADPVPYLQDARFGQSASMLNLMLGSGTPHSGLAPAFQTGGARSLQFVLRLRF